MTRSIFMAIIIFCASFCLGGGQAYLFAEGPAPEEDLSETLEPPAPGKDAAIGPSVRENAPIQTSAGTDRISLDLKGLDIVEVIKILAAKKNLSVVLGANVKGKVTIFLKDVDVMDAFDIILVSNELAYDRRGDIIYVMTQREYEDIYGERYLNKKEAALFRLKYCQVAEVAKALNQMKSKVGKVIADDVSNTVIAIDGPASIAQMKDAVQSMDVPTVTKIFELKYAKAADLKTNITDSLTKGIGSIRIDERTNKIVITDLESKMGQMSEMIAAFDARLQQVLIESKIVSITLDDRLKFGIDWQSFITKLNHEVMKKSIDIKSLFEIATAGSLNPGFQLILGSLNSSQDYAIMIQALKTIGDTNLLSSPRITAINNQEAKIMVGKSQPYATNTTTVPAAGGATVGTSLTFLDIGVKLFVTPTINKDGLISMKIKPEVSSSTTNYTYGSPATTVPVIETTQAETSVMVRDGTTIIIGGLIKDERTKSINKVPILGSIPWVGLLFQKIDDHVTKQEIVVFLTPHIITGMDDYLDQPKTAPVGEEGYFTTSDRTAFERRYPTPIDPSMFSRGDEARIAKYNQEQRGEQYLPVKGMQTTAIPSGMEEYNFIVKNRIAGVVAAKKPNWFSPLKGNASVTFVLSPDGKLASGPEVLDSSDRKAGAEAVKFVRRAAPFPAFPDSAEKSDKRFSVNLSFN